MPWSRPSSPGTSEPPSGVTILDVYHCILTSHWTHPMKWLPALLLLTACGGKTLVIESDTSWALTLDSYGTVTSRGNATYDVKVYPACWTVTKTDSLGTLRAYVETSTWMGLGNEVDGLATTSEPGGVVSGCTQ